MKYVGVKQSKKKRLVINRKGKIVSISTEDLLGGDCKRHVELLRGNEIAYRRYYAEQGLDEAVIDRKIEKFYGLVKEIDENGYNPDCKHPITVSENGARLDGSHRVAILNAMGVKEVQVKVVKWNMTEDELRHLEEQKRVYS